MIEITIDDNRPHYKIATSEKSKIFLQWDGKSLCWSGAEHKTLKFLSHRQAELFMEIVGFKKDTWLDGVIVRIEI